MGPFAIAALATQGAVALGRVAGGWIQARRARKEMQSAKQPMYQAPKEYGQQLGIQNQLIAGGLPGQDKMMDQYGALQAQQVAQAERRGGSAEQIRANVLAANQGFNTNINNLGIQAVQFQAQQQQNKIGLLNTGIDIHNTQFQTNQLDLFNRRYQESGDRWGAGQSMAWGGMNQMGSAFGNAAGLSEYSRGIDRMYPVPDNPETKS